MKGYELMKLVNEGKLSLEQKVSSISPDYKNCTIYFVLKDIAFKIMNLDFEVIEEQQDIDIQSIEEIPKILFLGTEKNDLMKVLNDIIDNQNLQLQAVKQLDKKMEEKNNGIK